MYGANNYGYLPYGRYIPQQPNTTPTFSSLQPSLNGKQVDSLDVVKAMDIPLDGSVSFFPIADGSAIATKQLQLDGTSKTIIYKPVEDTPVYETKYVTTEDLTKELDLIKNEINDLKEAIEELKKKKKGD